jgi:hypothetical protein
MLEIILYVWIVAAVVSVGVATLMESCSNIPSTKRETVWTVTIGIIAPPAGIAMLLILLIDSCVFGKYCGGWGYSFSPTPSPIPVITLSVSNPNLTYPGQSTILTWTVQNATQCTASGSWSGTQSPGGGILQIAPTTTSTYTLTCIGQGGSSQDSVTVTVGGAGGGPCHQYTPSTSIPSGFGSPYDVAFSSSVLLIRATCDSSGATIDLGTGNTLQYIYQTGYTTPQGATTWSQIPYLGQGQKVSNAWWTGSANATIATNTQTPITCSAMSVPGRDHNGSAGAGIHHARRGIGRFSNSSGREGKLVKVEKRQSPGMSGAFGGLLPARESRLGFGVRKLLGAQTGHRRIRVCAARRGRPPTFFNHLTLLP